MIRISILIAAVVCHALVAAAVQPLHIKLTDGSHLFANSSSDSLNVTLDQLDKQIDVPFNLIDRIEQIDSDKNGLMRLTMTNGDKLSVRISDSRMKLKAAFGDISIPIAQIQNIDLVEPNRRSKTHDVSVTVKTSTPGTPQIQYAGQTWDAWKIQWEVQDDRLVALGKVRPGFKYGHWANGRSGQITTGNADESWKDYEVAFDFHMQPASKEFFHASIPGESRGMAVFFRCKAMTESWNEPDTAYIFGVNPNGGWGLGAYDGFHCPGFGWNENFVGKQDELVTGNARSPLNDGVNHFRIRVAGATYTVWVNDEKLTEFTHKQGGKIEPIPYGGLGVRWRFESLGWISNFSVEHL